MFNDVDVNDFELLSDNKFIFFHPKINSQRYNKRKVVS